MRTNQEKSCDKNLLRSMAVAIVIPCLVLGCQSRTPPTTEKVVMELDATYRRDSTAVVVRPGESIRLGEARESMQAGAQLMGTDDGKAPPSTVTYVQKGDSVRLGEGAAKR